jgi:hypothetical protein
LLESKADAAGWDFKKYSFWSVHPTAEYLKGIAKDSYAINYHGGREGRQLYDLCGEMDSVRVSFFLTHLDFISYANVFIRRSLFGPSWEPITD